MEAIAEESLRRIWQFGANDLIKLLCGFGSLGLRHRPFLEAVASAIDWSLQQLPLRGLVQAAWFLAVLASPEHKVMTSIANQMLMQLEHLSLAELAGVAWSFASLRLRHGRLMQSIASQAAAKISEFDEEDLARLAWSFAALDLAPREFTRLLVAEAAKRDASQGPTTARGQWHGSQRRRQSRGHRHNSEELDERTREQSAGSPVERRAQRRRPSRRRREKAEKVEVSREVAEEAEEVLETPEPESTTAATASPVQEEQASEMSQEQASMQEHEWHELQSGEDKEPEYDALLEMLREQIRAGVQPRQEAAAVDIDGAGSELDQTDKARILELFEVQRVADQVASRKRSQSSWAKKKEKAERKLGREYIRNEISTAFNAQHDPSVRYYNSVAIRVKKGEKSVDTKTIEAVAQGKVENEGRTKEDRIMARRIA